MLHKSIHLLILYMKKLKYTDIEQFANQQSKDSEPAA